MPCSTRWRLASSLRRRRASCRLTQRASSRGAGSSFSCTFARRGADVRIVTLNMGLIRDSLSMLAPLIEGRLVAEDRPLRPAAVDAVVFSDPRFERAHTYALLPRVRRMCALHGLRLIVLQKPDPSVAAVTLRQLSPPGDPARAAWASRRMTWPSIGRGSCCPSAPG